MDSSINWDDVGWLQIITGIVGSEPMPGGYSQETGANSFDGGIVRQPVPMEQVLAQNMAGPGSYMESSGHAPNTKSAARNASALNASNSGASSSTCEAARFKAERLRLQTLMRVTSGQLHSGYRTCHSYVGLAVNGHIDSEQ
jgi:hypothetical protein